MSSPQTMTEFYDLCRRAMVALGRPLTVTEIGLCHSLAQTEANPQESDAAKIEELQRRLGLTKQP